MQQHLTPLAPRRIRSCALALAAALALAGCEAMPIAPVDEPTYTADVIQRDFHFQPAAGTLARGEGERLNDFLRSLRLRPQDSAQVYFGPTGSVELDAERLATLTGAFTGAPARLQVLASPALNRENGWADLAIVMVRRNGLLVVTCPNNALNTWERDYLTPVPDLGCANALNRANMASVPRDLTAPRELRGSDAVTSVAAIERYQADKVKTDPLFSTTGN